MQQISLAAFGSNGDGVFDNSECFAKAFEALKPNGVLHIEKGHYMTGPLVVMGKRQVVIELEKGVVIQFIDEETRYTPILSRWEGVNCYCMHPCLLITECDGVILTGEGTFDGNGSWWWEAASRKRNSQKGPVSSLEQELARRNPGYETQSGGGGGRQSQFLRPPLVQILQSNNIQLKKLTLQNSPFWTLHPLYSTNLFFFDVQIHNPKDAPNTDGIDVDSCRFVTIKRCLVDVGDDGIALKSGSGRDGMATNEPTTDILIEGCTVLNAHGGAVIGSETAAGIRDVQVRDCFFDGTDRGIRIKTRRGRGGTISNLHFLSVRMRANLCPLTVNMYYRCGSLDANDFSLALLAMQPTTPVIEHVLVEQCSSEDSTSSAAFIVGLPESPIQDLVIRDCTFTVAKEGNTRIEESEMYEGLPGVQGRGIRLRNVQVSIQNVIVEGVSSPFELEDGVTML